MNLEEIQSQIVSFVTGYGIQIIGAIVILLVGRIAAGVSRSWMRKALTLRQTDDSIISFASSLVYFVIITVAVLAALNKFGIQTTSFVAVMGAAGFAVGLALQGSLSNFAAGVLILVLRPFKVGDYIRAGGTEGTIKEIHLFVSELANLDNIKILVPNSSLLAGNIEVLTGYEKRRVLCPIGIGYGMSIEKARDVAKAIMSADPRTLDDPAPDCVVTEWGDSSINMNAVCWCKPSDYWAVFFDMNKAIKEAFDREKIEIPFPQRVVHNAA